MPVTSGQSFHISLDEVSDVDLHREQGSAPGEAEIATTCGLDGHSKLRCACGRRSGVSDRGEGSEDEMSVERLGLEYGVRGLRLLSVGIERLNGHTLAGSVAEACELHRTHVSLLERGPDQPHRKRNGPDRERFAQISLSELFRGLGRGRRPTNDSPHTPTALPRRRRRATVVCL